MCYTLYISTDSTDNIALRNSDLLYFEPVLQSSDDPCVSLLRFRNKWCVGTKSRCSCTLRHLFDPGLGFSPPVDWYPEKQDEIDATRELYRALLALLFAGHQVDLIDRWEGAEPQDIVDLPVALDEIPETAFRLFEDHRFELSVRAPTT